MNRCEVRCALEAIAEEEVPDIVDMWPDVQRRIIGASAARRPRRFPHQRGVFLPVVVLLVGICLAGSAYASLPLAQQALQRFQPQVSQAVLVPPLALSQTAHGATMTVNLAYTDAKETVIGFSVSGEVPPAIMTASGTTLTGPSGLRVDGPGRPYYVGAEGGAPIYLEWFGGTQSTSLQAVNLTLQQGPFKFRVPASVGKSRLEDKQQAAEVNGWTVALDSIAVTPSMVVVALRGAGPDASVDIVADGKRFHLYSDGEILSRDMRACWRQHEQCSSLWKDHETEYTLTDLGQDHNVDVAATANAIRQLSGATGPWLVSVAPDDRVPDPIFRLPRGEWTFSVNPQ